MLDYRDLNKDERIGIHIHYNPLIDYMKCKKLFSGFKALLSIHGYRDDDISKSIIDDKRYYVYDYKRFMEDEGFKCYVMLYMLTNEALINNLNLSFKIDNKIINYYLNSIRYKL